jgi:hypothetical protein
MEVGAMPTDTTPVLDHYLLYGEIHDTIDACDQLDVLLARLTRQHLLPPEECSESREWVQSVRQRLEDHIRSHDLTPKGPRLP